MNTEPRMPVEREVGRTSYTLQEIEESYDRGYRDGKIYGTFRAIAALILIGLVAYGAWSLVSWLVSL